MARGHPDFRFSTYVQTLAADNLIIDKLTTAAITEIKRILQNAGPAIGYASATAAARHGKFFPRQARGWLTEIGVECRNLSAKDETFYFRFSPIPGMGAIFLESFTVPAGAKAGVYTSPINRAWPYDSLFVWVMSTSNLLQYAYDEGEPTDAYHSEDSGMTWSRVDRRYHFHIGIAGQTCGDIPVSGTISTIPVLDRGFSYKDISVVAESVTVPAGEVGYIRFPALDLNEVQEIITLFIYPTETPAAPPVFYKRQMIAGYYRRGVGHELTAGVDGDVYELNLSQKRLFCTYTKGIVEEFGVKLTANATLDTTFYLQAVVSKFSILTHLKA